MRKPGKRIGGCIYVHHQYENQIGIEPKILKKAKSLIKWIENLSYTAIKYNKKTHSITFQWSYNFDTATEPIVNKCILVNADGTTKYLPEKKDPQIWHHKWMWVADDYKGFNVKYSLQRSELWKSYVTSKEKCKIGYLSFWKSIQHRWGE